MFKFSGLCDFPVGEDRYPNLLLGYPDKTIEDVIESIYQKIPQGYHSIVGPVLKAIGKHTASLHDHHQGQNGLMVHVANCLERASTTDPEELLAILGHDSGKGAFYLGRSNMPHAETGALIMQHAGASAPVCDWVASHHDTTSGAYGANPVVSADMASAREWTELVNKSAVIKNIKELAKTPHANYAFHAVLTPDSRFLFTRISRLHLGICNRMKSSPTFFDVATYRNLAISDVMGGHDFNSVYSTVRWCIKEIVHQEVIDWLYSVAVYCDPPIPKLPIPHRLLPLRENVEEILGIEIPWLTHFAEEVTIKWKYGSGGSPSHLSRYQPKGGANPMAAGARSGR